MRKKIRPAQNKDDLHDLGSDDLLSRLSDDILVSILSYLPLKDATATNKLSRRWRSLWCQTVRLDFDDKEIWNKITLPHAAEWKKYINLPYVERNYYINWVNHIIRQHKSPNIDEFKICFDLDKNENDAISKWIEFAISKNVQRLELDLEGDGFRFCDKGNYAFPYKIFDRKCESLLKKSSFNATVMENKFLKALILKHVDVNDEGLKKILSYCPVLEHLFIERSGKLVKAEIHGKGLALKNLEIISCNGLESIEICDSNIVSFNYNGFFSEGSPISFRLDNLQKLEKISISDYGMDINHMFCQIFYCIPYLQALELGFYCPQEEMQFSMFPKLPKLKQLKVEVGASDEGSLSVLTSLVEACPNLQRFTVQLEFTSFPMSPREENREEREAAKQLHQHLEVVEICSYYGLTSHLELATYFIKNGVTLKKLIIEPVILRYSTENGVTEEENGPRYHAQQHLEPRKPVGLELVIL